MKRVFLTIYCIILLLISLFTTNVYAVINSFKCELIPSKTEYNVGDEILVTFKLSSLDADKGIIAYSAVLDYDKDKLEYVELSGTEKWITPSYNAKNGKLIADRNDDFSALSNENLCTIKFKALKSANNVQIKLKDIELANGDESIKSSDGVQTTITISSTENSSSQSSEQSQSSSSSSSQSSKQSQSSSSSSSQSSKQSQSSSSSSSQSSKQSQSSSSSSSQSSEQSQSSSSSSSQSSEQSQSSSSSSNDENNNIFSSEENNSSNSTSSKDDKQANEIPRLGTNMYPIIFICLIAFVAIIWFAKIKLIDKRIKMNNNNDDDDDYRE